MKKTASLILATLLSVSLWADDLNSEFQKVKNYLEKTYSSNQVSYRIQINKLNRIINSNQSEKDKLAALKKEFPHLYNSWQKELDAAKTVGIKFSADNKTLIKCPQNIFEVIIPSCVTTIGDRAFYYCKNLKNVTIPNSVTAIGERAFSCCSNLTSVTIPNSVTTIGGRVFDGVVTVAENHPVFMVDKAGALINVNEGVMINLPKNYQGHYTILEGVITIEGLAFSGCSSLTSVTIPNGVTTIGNGAFSGCSSLTSVTLPDSVTRIGDRAFGFCKNLTSITIPDSVTTIGRDAFLRCSSLKSVSISRKTKYEKNSFPEGCQITVRN